MNRPFITGLILTHGDRRLSPTLESIQGICEQIVLVADDSADISDLSADLDTFEGDIDVVHRTFDTFPRQRNAGIEKSIGEWVMVIDSDETASQNLRTELESFRPMVTDDIFTLPRREIFRGRELKRVTIGGPHPRLFRSHLRYAQKPEVHERLSGLEQGGVRSLEGHLLHHRSGSIGDLLRKEYLYGKTFGEFGGPGEQSLSWYRLLRQSIGEFAVREGLSEGIEGAVVTLANIVAQIGEKQSSSKK